MLQADLAHKGKINMKLYDGPSKLLAITLRVGFTFLGEISLWLCCAFLEIFGNTGTVVLLGLNTLFLLFIWFGACGVNKGSVESLIVYIVNVQ